MFQDKLDQSIAKAANSIVENYWLGVRVRQSEWYRREAAASPTSAQSASRYLIAVI
jgi:hypothetical protein